MRLSEINGRAFTTKSLRPVSGITHADQFCVTACLAYTQGDSDVISMPAGCRRHLVGKTLINICCCNIAEIRSVAELVIIDICLLTDGLNFI